MQGFLRRFRDPNRVPRISNRVPRIRESYHRVPKIKENRVARIREIGSLQIHTGFLTFSLKKNCLDVSHYKNMPKRERNIGKPTALAMKRGREIDWKRSRISVWRRWGDQSFEHYITQGVSLRQGFLTGGKFPTFHPRSGKFFLIWCSEKLFYSNN